MKTLAPVLLALVAPLASAAPADYAMQWPVHPARAGAGAYAVVLTPEVYDAVQRPDLRDLDVLDARGRAVPADVVAPAATSTTRTVALPWFAMPSPDAGPAGRWRVIADLDAEGRLRGLQSSTAVAPARATSLLVDAALLQAPRERNDALVALDLDWAAGAPFDRAFRVEGSDDFDGWRPLGRGRLVDIRQDGRALRLHRIALDAAAPAPRYLRLVSEDGDAPLPAMRAVRAELARTDATGPSWLSLAPRGAGRTFEFDVPGRYPVRWVDLEVDGNDARTWRLQSRDGDGRWIDRLDGWAVYRLGARRSPPQVFDRPLRDRQWRLVASADGAAPRLRLGYRPERLVFVAAGTPPYTVVAGSATSQRSARPATAALPADAPIADARLGDARVRAGGAALERPRDWKTWGLWAVLAAGVALVGAFALRVLREPAPAAD